MAEHQQEQYLRQGYAVQVRTKAISEEQNGAKREDGKYDDAVEDPWESEPEEPDHAGRLGQQAFARRRDHQISSQKSTWSERYCIRVPVSRSPRQTERWNGKNF